MTRLMTIAALTSLATSSVACIAAADGGAAARAPDIASPAADREGDPGRAPGEDEHWFTDEDYLVSKRPYGGRPLLWMRQGKMMTPPTGSTKAEARFLLANGEELWSPHYWRTRVATERDLSIGALVFCPQSGRVPSEKRGTRRMLWMLGAVTDLSDLYKGKLAVGSRDCDVRGVRVSIE